MVFSGIPFLFFFLPIFFILYFIVPFKLKNLVLLLFSLVFYAWGEPTYIFLMLFTSAINYFLGLLTEKYDNDCKKRKLFLLLAVIINLALLGFFKYADFLIISINDLFNVSIPLLKLGLPIGISFYTFQIMSYNIGVYRRENRVEHSFLNFMTYVSMFPQLIAGPIVRYETVSAELKKREINFKNYSEGFLRFLLGLFKKVLIANGVGHLWSSITALPSNEFSILLAWLGLVAFTIQIYFDFSGYSDMAIGMGKMLGFNYLENFNYPYVATSITDFWRRWHISLSSWFRDYVYIPLGGSKVSKIFNIRNILIVWALTGLWHGAYYNFIIWGLYYGIILIVEKFVLKNALEKAPNWLKHFYTIFLVMIGWLIFAFDDMTLLNNYSGYLFNIIKYPFININFIYYFKNYFFIIMAGIIFSTPIINTIKQKLKNIKGFDNHFKVLLIRLCIYMILLLITVSYLVSDTYNPFLYFRF